MSSDFATFDWQRGRIAKQSHPPPLHCDPLSYTVSDRDGIVFKFFPSSCLPSLHSFLPYLIASASLYAILNFFKNWISNNNTFLKAHPSATCDFSVCVCVCSLNLKLGKKIITTCFWTQNRAQMEKIRIT